MAETGGDDGKLLRVGTTYYHPPIPETRIVPGTNKYLLNDQISKGKVPCIRSRDQVTVHNILPIPHSFGMISGIARLVSLPVSLPQAQMQIVLIRG